MSQPRKPGNPHPPVRTLVVDDSFFMRTLISDLLRADPEIDVVGAVGSGVEAIQKTAELKPDCVTLDLAMPGFDGVRTLNILMSAYQTRVVIISAHNRQGHTDLRSRCLAAGAVGFIQKPSGELSLDIETVAKQLITEVKHAVPHSGNETAVHSRVGRPARAREDCVRPAFHLTVLGASTGGQAALQQIAEGLGPDCTGSVLIVQHTPNRFLTEQFADRLNRSCALPVKVADDGDRLAPGIVYVAPGGYHLLVNRVQAASEDAASGARPAMCEHRFQVAAAPPNGLTPSIDLAMCSAASAVGPNMLGVILTGSGQDGVEGMRAIKSAGGRTLVQDESAEVPDMPRSVIAAELADRVLTVTAIARAIERSVRQ